MQHEIQLGMEYSELRTAIDGIHAYDTGCVDSGTKDERLRQQVVNYARSLDPPTHRKLIAKLVMDLCLSEEALSEGYGPEDAKELLEWLDDQGILIAA